jgi:hypothetical protein
MENLARYIIRASFSQERMSYVPEESKVIYQLRLMPPNFEDGYGSQRRPLSRFSQKRRNAQ